VQQLISGEQGKSTKSVIEYPRPHLRREWAAVFVGLAFWLSIQQPWSWTWWSARPWLNVYDVVTQLLLFGVLGWLIYTSLWGSRHLSKLSRQQLELDIFNPGVLIPVARSSLSLTLAFISGITFSIVFQTQESLLLWNNITVYAILVCVTLILFFLSMWSIHSAMAENKRRELDLVQEHLAAASRELKERAVQGRLEKAEELSSTISLWVTYEKRVKEVPTWPFNAGIIRRLAMSVLIPVAVYLVRIITQFLLRFGF